MEPGRSIFPSIFCFDFGLDLGLVWDTFWARLGLLLALFWEPKSSQVGPKMHLESSVFFENVDFSRHAVPPWREPHFSPKMGLKIGPRGGIKLRCIFRVDF